MKKLALALILLAFLVVAGGTAARFAMFAMSAASPPRAGAEGAPRVVIEVKRAQAPSDIAKTLVAKGVVTDARMFMWLGRITRQWTSIKAGEYEVSADLPPLKIFQVLTSGVSVAHPITVREGENMYEIADSFQELGLATRERILALCKDPKFIASLGFADPPAVLEGYLYPDTYFFNRALTPEEMLRQMIKKFSTVWGPTEDERAKALGLTRHQAVTMASMIEKETGAGQERPMIASVFYNRLRKKMKLQSDPTTIYGIWERYQGNLHKGDLLSQTAFNTYVIPGLPIGPIGNPGKEALQAVLAPSTTEYIFFVSHNDGTHEFTRTLDEHNAAVRRFQLDPKARAGKSWRDLSRKSSAEPGAGAAASPQ